MPRQLYILLLLLGFPFFSDAQEVISVYFKTGSHKVSPYSVKVIEDKLKSLNYDELSYIACIGYSDSSGNLQSNRRLSERRAKAVAKECGKFLKDEVPLSVSFKGETTQKVDSLSRRVDIIIHYLEKLETHDSIVLKEDEERCFGTDEEIYRFIHTRKLTGKQKSMIYLEMLDEYSNYHKKHYFIKNPGTPNAVAQRVNWKKQKTGKLWWRETRLTATIPRESFEKYGLVVLQEPPCDGCTESLFRQDTNLVMATYYTENYFLESVTQFKTKFLRRNHAEIRVPREYVDSSGDFRVHLSTRSNEYKNLDIEWEPGTKNKTKDYYFYNFNIKYYDYIDIQARQPMWTCRAPSVIDTSDHRRMSCGCRWHSDYLYLRTTVSAFYHNDTLTSYAALRFGYQTEMHQFQTEIGLNHRLGFYGSLSYRWHYLNIGLMKNRGISGWKKMSEVSFSTYFTPYVGVELRTSYTRNYKSFTEVNLHTGFSMNYGNRFGYYVHGGIARDLSNTINTDFYPYLQAGITYTFEFRLN